MGVSENLPAKEISSISTFSSLRELELGDWRTWEDLSPLRSLALEGLSCEDVCLLFSLLKVGHLETLKALTLKHHGMFANEDTRTWLGSMAMTGEEVLAQVTARILELPVLSTMGCGIIYSAAGGDHLARVGMVGNIVGLNPARWLLMDQHPQHIHYCRVRG